MAVLGFCYALDDTMQLELAEQVPLAFAELCEGDMLSRMRVPDTHSQLPQAPGHLAI